MRRPLATVACLSLAALLAAPALANITRGGPVGPDGKTEVSCDLPLDQRIKNVGSRIDGAGMCVFTSIEMTAHWQNLEPLRGWRDWCAKTYPGGGYPSKVDKLLKAFCDRQKIAIPAYLQYEGRDPSVIDLAIRTGRMVAVTYGSAHMVCCVHLDAERACLLDNNATGENQLLWMTRQDFVRRWTAGQTGWCFIFLAPPPPPPPTN